MTAWPASLPQKQFLGLSTQDEDAVIRTQMDTGPPTRRNRFTAITQTVDVSITLRGDQKQTFDTFFRDTLKNGAFAFDWEDPTTDATISFAFRSPPTWTLPRGGTPDTRVWEATLNLQVQP